MKREFEDIMDGLQDTVATYSYYVDFEKVYKNIGKIEIQLNLLNYLIGKEDVEQKFVELVNEYPKVLEVIPILLAVRKSEIKIIDGEQIVFDFKKQNKDICEYVKLLNLSGIFDMFTNKKIKNVVDYVTGVEVGLDTNARKNRTGHVMEDIVESYIKKIPNIQYIKEATKDIIKDTYNTDVLNNLVLVEEDGKANKRFDFVFKTKNGVIVLIETNFYSSNGSKLNETARSYKKLAEELKKINKVKFVWITDGIGWKGAKNNLKEAYDYIDDLYTIKDLENGILNAL
jgi:type II restriction enzyme